MATHWEVHCHRRDMEDRAQRETDAARAAAFDAANPHIVAARNDIEVALKAVNDLSYAVQYVKSGRRIPAADKLMGVEGIPTEQIVREYTQACMKYEAAQKRLAELS